MSGVIPNTICNLTKLETFRLWELNLSGTIPECIGNELQNLIDFELGYLKYLNASIPASFNNLTHLEVLVFEQLPLLTGIIHTPLMANNNFTAVDISNVSLSGQLHMSALCSNDNNLQHLYIGYNDKLTVNISDCKHPLSQLIDLWIDDSTTSTSSFSST